MYLLSLGHSVGIEMIIDVEHHQRFWAAAPCELSLPIQLDLLKRCVRGSTCSSSRHSVSRRELVRAARMQTPPRLD